MTLGVILAVALGALALANWAERGRFGVPEDGVSWSDSEAGVLAVRVAPDSPAALVGVRPGDLLRAVAGRPVEEALDVTRILSEIGAWSRAEYVVERDSRTATLTFVIGESSSRGAVGWFQFLLGWAYAAIGLLVWLRGRPGTATVRFFLFCMASLALYSLSATGRLEGIDRLVYWIDVWALLLVPALLVDFCDRFPAGVPRHRSWVCAAYGLAAATGAAHHAAAGNWLGGGISDSRLVSFFDAVPLVLLVALSLLAAISLYQASRAEGSPLHALQARSMLFGAVAAVAPFAVLYVLPFMFGAQPGPNQAFAVFSLAALPVAVAVALLRYRLLEVELFWRRAVAAAGAAVILLAAVHAVLFQGIAPLAWLERHAPVLWLASLAVAAGLYRPVRDRILGLLERRAHRERLEERRSLAAFAAELATDTDLSRLTAAVSARLGNALNVERVAVLGRADASGGRETFRLLSGTGIPGSAGEASIDLASIGRSAPAFGDAVLVPDLRSEDVPPQIAGLGCHHFVPCRLRGRAQAWIALGLSRGGNLLTSEDLALAEAVASPLAIALENARLYESLQAKAVQYQRLKDYNENIVESLSVGILALDLDGRVTSWNAQLELALHISRQDAVGRHLGELLPQALIREVSACIDDNGAGQIHRFRLKAADFPAEFRPAKRAASGERIYNVAVAPLIAKDFTPVGRLLILDDISERVELEERLVRADRLSATGTLAAGVAHEVNTPLAVISSYAQMLATKFSQESDEARMLDKVTEQTFRASEIVSSLLDFSRVSSARMEPCDINGAIADTLDLVAPQLRQAGIAVKSRLAAQAPATGNRSRLQQVFLNLFLNARDAMPSGGTLGITTQVLRQEGGADRIEVLVSDTGIGIDKTELSRIFDPFYTTKGRGRGSGLGLAVSYGIVREHSGEISVESVTGEGTVFSLVFPAAEQAVHA